MRQPTRGAPPGPGFASVSSSDVGPRLAAVDVDAGAREQAGLSRADECDHVRDLIDGSEAAHRHLLAYKVRDALRICLLPAGPSPAFPKDRTGRHRVDGHPF